MTVADLIEYLKEQPQDVLVAYKLHSEQKILEFKEISLVEHCNPRPDGWVQRKRADMETQKYLLLPGN